MDFLSLFIGIAIGIAFTWLFFRNRQGGAGVLPGQDEKINALSSEKANIEGKLRMVTEQSEEVKKQLQHSSDKVVTLSSELAQWKARYGSLEEKLKDNKTELESLQQKFTAEFQNLANKIFEEKGKKFTEQNEKNIAAILEPLKTNIKEFEKKVNDVYVSETKERASLAEQIKNLHALNQQMTKEADNLTKALTGNVKTQGNWGEMMLEMILERSGLRKDIEYVVQGKDLTLKDEEGNRLQPDVIVNLPDNKHIIIDSKVSLNAYSSLIEAQTDEQKQQFTKDLLVSVRKHIDDLSGKYYQNLNGINSPDFVLMFMPTEGVFSVTMQASAAMQADTKLFNYAWDKKIVIVSPTTLWATLKTIASIWKQENQAKNALEIARQGGALYDKFVGFIEDMDKIGSSIENTRKAYESAVGKLHKGAGNLVKRVQELEKLGAKANKALPEKFLNTGEE